MKQVIQQGLILYEARCMQCLGSMSSFAGAVTVFGSIAGTRCRLAKFSVARFMISSSNRLMVAFGPERPD